MARAKSFDVGLTTPALLAVVGFVIVAAFMLLPIDRYRFIDEDGNYTQEPYSLGRRLYDVVWLALLMLLLVYNIQCVSTGNCNVWSWVQAVIVFLMVMMIIVEHFLIALLRK